MDPISKFHPGRRRKLTDSDFALGFWQRIFIRDTGCWEWQASKKRDGYGQVKCDGRMQLTHRVAYELCIGLIPPGMKVCHHCDNPPCVNPLHLFLGSDADNNHDMILKGRAKHIRGSQVARARFTEAEVKAIRAEWVPYKFSASKLAAKHGVHKSCIEKILRRVTWCHV